jgi:hypothetical protein
MRHAIGISVFSGMLGVTFFGLIFTPIFYVALRLLEVKLTGNKDPIKMHGDDIPCALPKGHARPMHQAEADEDIFK